MSCAAALALVSAQYQGWPVECIETRVQVPESRVLKFQETLERWGCSSALYHLTPGGRRLAKLDFSGDCVVEMDSIPGEKRPGISVSPKSGQPRFCRSHPGDTERS